MCRRRDKYSKLNDDQSYRVMSRSSPVQAFVVLFLSFLSAVVSRYRCISQVLLKGFRFLYGVTIYRVIDNFLKKFKNKWGGIDTARYAVSWKPDGAMT